jgi:peptidoglycan/xylan/chitin deacetylase (PgdA/CDA1 family)
MRAPALVIAGAGAAWCAPAPAAVVPGLAGLLGIALRSAGDTVALTFDDGPHPQGTPATLAALAQAGARATFFLAGEQVRRDPALAAEIAAQGHAVGIHCERHRNLLRLGPRALARDLDHAADAIGAATGARPVLHRAPYGIYSAGALREVRRRGWVPVLWSRWGRDWVRGATPARIAATAAAGVGGGDVVLLHDSDAYSAPGSWRATVAALPQILAAVSGAGLRAEPLRGPADLAQSCGW